MEPATKTVGRPTPGKHYVAVPGPHGFRTIEDRRTGDVRSRKYVVELTICDGPFTGVKVEYVGGLEGDGLGYTLTDLAKMGMSPDCLDPSEAKLDQKVQFKFELSEDGLYERVKYIDTPPTVSKNVDEGFRAALKRQIAARRGLTVNGPEPSRQADDDGVPF